MDGQDGGQGVNWITDNWHILAGFAAGLVAWGKTTNDVSNNKKGLAEARQDITQMKDSLARIETHQEYTRENIEKLTEHLLKRQ